MTVLFLKLMMCVLFIAAGGFLVYHAILSILGRTESDLGPEVKYLGIPLGLGAIISSVWWAVELLEQVN